jgi:hypothetical protein
MVRHAGTSVPVSLSRARNLCNAAHAVVSIVDRPVLFNDLLNDKCVVLKYDPFQLPIGNDQ